MDEIVKAVINLFLKIIWKEKLTDESREKSAFVCSMLDCALF